MHERRHASDECVAVEDAVDQERLDDDGNVDRDPIVGRDLADDLGDDLIDDLTDDTLLREALSQPGRYLPPPSVQASRDPEPAGPEPEPEHPLARRAKLAALVLAAAMVIASIIVAAVVTGDGGVTGQGDTDAESLRSAPGTQSVSFFTVTQPF
ncbi:hypothetical protein [Prauserella rugosa]|uniref:Uncharacterized protein n=1 Tax=Prauserella rugosa TaxID=43354 RepID=A0A660CFE2_9PSEU|nr:hypothetical protein [Prauserella rugosa]KMS91105.1 hypothetical protein ACZ91_11455 [Streptomyces regensis]TWH22298.1 hypothetical protein JD82_04175 [Prauserella rugosa]